jgi:hypothetical protein
MHQDSSLVINTPMKTFQQYLNEDNFPQVRLAVGLEKGHDEININNKAVRDKINNQLAFVTTDSYLTPYLGLEKIRKVLATYHIFVPKYVLFDNDQDIAVFEINQFGSIFDNLPNSKGDNPNYYIYFEFLMQSYGNYNIFCELVTDDELESLVNDADDSMELSEDIFKSIKKKIIAQKMSDAGGQAVGDLARAAKDAVPAISKGLGALGRFMGVGSKDDGPAPAAKPKFGKLNSLGVDDGSSKSSPEEPKSPPPQQKTDVAPAPKKTPAENPIKTDPAGRKYQVSADGKTTKWFAREKSPEMITTRNLKEAVTVLRPGSGPAGLQPKGGDFKLGDEDADQSKSSLVDKLKKFQTDKTPTVAPKTADDKSPAVAPKVTDAQKDAATKSLTNDLSKSTGEGRQTKTSRVAPYQSDKPIPGVVKPGLDSTVKSDNGKPVTDIKVKRSIDTAATPIKAGNTRSIAPTVKDQDRHPAMADKPATPVADKKVVGTEVKNAPVPRPRPQLGEPKKPVSNFGKAFAQARQKLGKKGVFSYQGKKYTTKRADDLRENKDDLRAMVAAALKSKDVPITKVAAGTTSNINRSAWKRAMQTGGKVKVNKTFNVNPQSLAPSATFRGKATGFRKNLDENIEKQFKDYVDGLIKKGTPTDKAHKMGMKAYPATKKRKVNLVYKSDKPLDKESFDAALQAAQAGNLKEELKKYNVHFKHMETKEPKVIEVHANNETQATNLGHAKLGEKQKFYRHKKTVANVMLSELSQKALKNYIGNASRHVNSVMAGANKEPVEKTNKRIKNIYKAHDKTGSYSGFNEEENIQELSKRFLRSYKKKATIDTFKHDKAASDAHDEGNYYNEFKHTLKQAKRLKGISKASGIIKSRKGKIEELSMQTLDNYKDKVSKEVHLGRDSPKRAAGSRLASNKLDRSKPTKKKFPYSKLYAGVHKQTTNARVLAKEDNIDESTPTSKDYLNCNRNRQHEIEWTKNKIKSLLPKLAKKPSTMKQIKDLERQIRERGGTPDPINEAKKSTAWDRLTKGYKKAYGTDLNQSSKEQAKAKENLKKAGKDYEKITTRK